MTSIETTNNCKMIIAQMDKIKDDLMFRQLYSISDKQDNLRDRMNTLEDKMNLIIKLLGDNNG